jgi:hypothetical protein
MPVHRRDTLALRRREIEIRPNAKAVFQLGTRWAGDNACFIGVPGRPALRSFDHGADALGVEEPAGSLH